MTENHEEKANQVKAEKEEIIHSCKQKCNNCKTEKEGQKQESKCIGRCSKGEGCCDRSCGHV